MRGIVLAFGILVLAAGCSGQPQGKVTGIVSVSGVPLDAGLITFIGDEKPFQTESAGIRQGTFETAAMPTGRYTVVIKVIQPPSTNRPEPERDRSPSQTPNPTKKLKPNVNYEAPQLSGLTYTVTEGASEAKFQLEPQPN